MKYIHYHYMLTAVLYRHFRGAKDKLDSTVVCRIKFKMCAVFMNGLLEMQHTVITSFVIWLASFLADFT